MTSGRFKSGIQDGALALELGWDPIKYLSLEGVERTVAAKVLQQALDNRADEQSRYWKNIQIAVQNGVAKAFGGKK